MGLLDGGRRLGLGEVAGDLDDVGPRRELLAHRLAPVVRSLGLAHLRVVQLSVGGSRARAPLGAVAARAHDEPARREHPRTHEPAFLHPLLQLEGHVVAGAHVAHARDTALDVVAELLRPAQRARGVGGLGAVGVRVVEVGVQVDEPGHHGAAGHVDHARGGGPVGGAGQQDLRDAVALDDERSVAGGGAGTVEEPAAPQDDRALGPLRTGGHGDARGSSLVGVPGARERRRSEARDWAVAGVTAAAVTRARRATMRVFISLLLPRPSPLFRIS